MPNQLGARANQDAKDLDSIQRIIVIGASSGGFEAMKKIIRSLPPDFSIPIFIVWHMSSDLRGVLPQVLNRENKILAAHAYDNEPIKPNRIYVAPPDYHMLVTNEAVRVTHGPKENRFRPAVDPLFRSAAFAFTNQVIGVILSGALDDGTIGLWTIKKYGGIAIVQDPLDAEVPSMPENAMRETAVDYSLPADQIAGRLVELSTQSIKKADILGDDQTRKEIQIAAECGVETGKLKFKELTPYTCPECHGVLSRLHNDQLIHYRCHTGHAYTTDALLAALSEKVEDSLYSAIRGSDETVMLLNHIGDHYAEINNPKLAAVYFRKAKEASDRAGQLHKVAWEHERLSKEKLSDATKPKTEEL